MKKPKSLLEENGYKVMINQDEIFVFGKVILPTVRKMLSKVGKITQSEYRSVVAKVTIN